MSRGRMKMSEGVEFVKAFQGGGMERRGSLRGQSRLAVESSLAELVQWEVRRAEIPHLPKEFKFNEYNSW